MTSGSAPRRADTLARLRSIAADLSGCREEELTESASFLQLGFDSLFMTQLAATYKQAFGIGLTFRQLIDEHPSLGALADYIAPRQPQATSGNTVSPAGVTASASAAAAAAASNASSVPARKASHVVQPPPGNVAAATDPAALLQTVIQRQLALMDLQIEQLRRVIDSQPQAGATAENSSLSKSAQAASAAPDSVQAALRLADPARVAADQPTASPLSHRHHVERLAARLRAQTPTSARQASPAMPLPSQALVAAAPADIAPSWRGMDYPLLVAKSLGAHVWDADENRYIDLSLGGGALLFGHASDIISAAIGRCVSGAEPRPLATLVKDATQRLRGVTGLDHVLWMRSGGHALAAAIDTARRRTGRNRIVSFASAASRAGDVTLRFGAPEALDEIRRQAADVAAIVLDPAHDDWTENLREDDARAFAQDLRKLATELGILLVADERAGGFRMHPGGGQGWLGVPADLAAYGGLLETIQPLGALASSMPLFCPADSDCWPAGALRPGSLGASPDDDAGPGLILAMSCAHALLDAIDTQGATLPARLAETAAALCDGLNRIFEAHGASIQARRRGSQVTLRLDEEPLAALLYWHLRVRGIHAAAGRPLFLSTAHDDDDIAQVLAAVEDSIQDLQDDQVIARASSAGPCSWQRIVPVTSSQRELFFASQLGELASCAYNESDAIRITGPLDAPLLIQTIGETLARHEAFRMRFDEFGEMQTVARQAVDPAADFPVQQVDLSLLDAPAAEAQLAAVVAKEALTPFDLQNGPLARVHLLKMPAETHVLLMYFHHIAFDGYSGQVVMEEIADAYNARRRGDQSRPSQAKPYSVFVYQSQARAGKDITNRSLAYWQSLYANDPVRPLELPTDRPRGPVRRPAAATVHREWGPDVLQAAKTLAKAQGTTLFAALLAGFQALLARIARQDDVVVAIPAAGQAHLGLETVGYCVTTLPIRSRPARNKAFADHARETQRAVLDALDHQDVNLGSIIRSLRLPGSRARLPLAEIMFNFSGFLANLEIEGCRVVAHENSRRAMFYDMFLHAAESDGRLIMDWDFRTDLFDAVTVERWLDGYRELLLAAARIPAMPIGDLPTAELSAMNQ